MLPTSDMFHSLTEHYGNRSEGDAMEVDGKP